jgi:hypothetical protein
MGNRGCLHDAQRELRTQFTSLRRWICCVTSFGGRKRVPMSPGQYTELFFLDEATALAAGHRPCVECRREAFQRYRSLAESHLGRRLRAGDLDDLLSAQRPGPNLAPPRTSCRLADVPDGAMVIRGVASQPDVVEAAWLVWGESLYRWSHQGYVDRVAVDRDEWGRIITPELSVAVLRAGYIPLVHATAAHGAATTIQTGGLTL